LIASHPVAIPVSRGVPHGPASPLLQRHAHSYGSTPTALPLARTASGHLRVIANHADGERRRSGSITLPLRTGHVPPPARDGHRRNVFDIEPYRTESRANHLREIAIGRALIADPEVCAVARCIRVVTGTPLTMSAFPPADRREIAEKSTCIGGAKELMADLDNLDGHVMAVLVKAEHDEYSFFKPEAPAAGVDDLPFDVPARRQCLFNHVADKANPIYPWNSHRFDLEIHEVSDASHYPERVRNLIADRWNDFIGSHDDATGYIRRDLGLPRHDARSGVFDVLGALTVDARRDLLEHVLHIAWSTEESIDDEQNHRSSNPLGPGFRQHKTGARSNVVRFRSTNDLSVNRWVAGAMVHGKPVVSGPSGHTLRYLNHYAMCKTMDELSGVDVSAYPSLEDARVVMLANLLAPKNHHSYHEVMLASIGVAAGEHEVLGYHDMGGYADLEGTPLGRRALANAAMALRTTP
jgi:hypothetical protein